MPALSLTLSLKTPFDGYRPEEEIWSKYKLNKSQLRLCNVNSNAGTELTKIKRHSQNHRNYKNAPNLLLWNWVISEASTIVHSNVFIWKRKLKNKQSWHFFLLIFFSLHSVLQINQNWTKWHFLFVNLWIIPRYNTHKKSFLIVSRLVCKVHTEYLLLSL